jgi:hypothetical protein
VLPSNIFVNANKHNFSIVIEVDVTYIFDYFIKFTGLRICNYLRNSDITRQYNLLCTIEAGLIQCMFGRAVAEAVSHWLPPRQPEFASGQHVVFVVDKAALGQVFSKYFGFP